MPLRWDLSEHTALWRESARGIALAVPLGMAVGSAVALFLWLLDLATTTRWQQPWLMVLMPVAGVLIVVVYQRLGKGADGGNNLIIEQIHQPGGGVPRRMAPLVLGATILTHLVGGSAGREGTAVQMGGSIAQGFADGLRLDQHTTRVLLMVGVAAGFGAVFGTPLTGAVFALEVLTLGRLQRTDALVPCLVGAFVGDATCTAWGIGHTHYHIASIVPAGGLAIDGIDALLVAKVALASVAFGLASVLFTEATHSVAAAFRRFVAPLWLRPVLGAGAVLGLAWALGTTDYLGLGVTTADGAGVSIVNAFEPGGATPLSWLWKIVFTVVTIGSGFKGGEVTPLFFVGATLGHVLGVAMGVPVDLMAGLGFVAVFAGATNTPLACTIMGVELFGAEHLPLFALACFGAFLFSGHTGIYLSQRSGDDDTLRSVRERRGPWLGWGRREG